MNNTLNTTAPQGVAVIPFRTSAEAPREKRPRIAPGDYIRCASTAPAAEGLLRRVATVLKEQPVRTGPAVMANSRPVELVVPQAMVLPRGRPSKIAAAARARLLGPADQVIPVSLVKTTNYDQFIIPTGVAHPTEAEVEAMVGRIELANGLLWNPIRVTPYLEVYDGKVRLEAARRLGYELAYVVDEALSVGHIIADRGEPRGWEFDQYCLYYAEQGRVEYRRLLDFAKAHALPLGAAASLLGGGSSTASTEAILTEFKQGRFRVTNEAHARQVVAIRDEYREKIIPSQPTGRDITKQRVFLNSISHTLAQPGVDPDQMHDILPQIRWQPTEADYDRHVARLLREARNRATA